MNIGQKGRVRTLPLANLKRGIEQCPQLIYVQLIVCLQQKACSTYTKPDSFHDMTGKEDEKYQEVHNCFRYRVLNVLPNYVIV